MRQILSDSRLVNQRNEHSKRFSKILEEELLLDDEKRLDDQRLRNVPGRRIIEIIPSQDSYGLLGCLNSNPERARKLIELGYRDAMRKLAHKVP